MAYIVDIGSLASRTGERTVDIDGNNHGYVVSHRYFGLINYLVQRNWSLTLTNLRSYEIEIEFELFKLQKPTDGTCTDYLLMSTKEKLCNKQTGKKVLLNLYPSTDITFSLISNNKSSTKGFWLKYRGNLSSNHIFLLDCNVPTMAMLS